MAINLMQAKRLIKAVYRIQLQTKERMSIELISQPGIGKSMMMKQVARELGEEMNIPFQYKDFFVTTVEPPDVAGFALPSKDTDGTPILQRTKAPWHIREHDAANGILGMDEFAQGNSDVKKPCAELFLSGRVGETELPIEWMVIAASNRSKDRSGVGRELAFITNRRMELHIVPHLDSWMEWAQASGVHWLARSFANKFPGVVFGEMPEKEGPFCSPRSFCKMAEMIDPLQNDPQLFLEAASGWIGEGNAAQFIAYTRVQDDMPEYADIVANPEDCKLPSSTRPDAQYATMQMISQLVSPEDAVKAFTYLKRMPKEFQIAGLKASLSRCKEMVQNRDFALWIRDNKDLIVAANLLRN